MNLHVLHEKPIEHSSSKLFTSRRVKEWELGDGVGSKLAGCGAADKMLARGGADRRHLEAENCY